MSLLSAFICLMLAIANGFIFSKFHSDVAYIVANLFIATGIICAALGFKK